MISSLVIESAQHPYDGGSSSQNQSNMSYFMFSSDVQNLEAPSPSGASGWEPPIYGLDISNFGLAFMNFVFAFMAHAGVPGLLQVMENKKEAPRIFIGAMSTACFLYLVLGILSGLYFGIGPAGIKSLVTLDWFDFNGKNNNVESGDTFATIVSYVVRLYPCVSVTSAFVLYADTLASSMRVVVCGTTQGKCVQVLSRWFVIVLSLVGAALMIKIDLIVGVCGIFGVNLVMVFPALLQMYSKQQCQDTFGRHTTPFSWHFSKNIYTWAMLVFAVFTAALGVYSLVHSFLN